MEYFFSYGLNCTQQVIQPHRFRLQLQLLIIINNIKIAWTCLNTIVVTHMESTIIAAYCETSSGSYSVFLYNIHISNIFSFISDTITPMLIVLFRDGWLVNESSFFLTFQFSCVHHEGFISQQLI